ncbi:MAG: aminotransferase class IV, partial [Hyphomonadaceae bacterium]|nr:aminotransferase class IV [Hyphomonadaceae bacterium]
MALPGPPFHDRDGFIWFDGQLVPWREANIHVLTHGLHYASAVFEGERAYGGEIFKLREHSERLIASAQMLDFDIPYTIEQIDAACITTLKANNLVDGYVRPIAWRGSELMGVTTQVNGVNVAKIHLAIAAWAWGTYFDAKERL